MRRGGGGVAGARLRLSKGGEGVGHMRCLPAQQHLQLGVRHVRRDLLRGELPLLGNGHAGHAVTSTGAQPPQNGGGAWEGSGYLRVAEQHDDGPPPDGVAHVGRQRLCLRETRSSSSAAD